MYAKYNSELDNYEINIYFTTSDGLEKFIIYSDTLRSEEKTIEDKMSQNRKKIFQN